MSDVQATQYEATSPYDPGNLQATDPFNPGQYEAIQPNVFSANDSALSDLLSGGLSFAQGSATASRQTPMASGPAPTFVSQGLSGLGSILQQVLSRLFSWT